MAKIAPLFVLGVALSAGTSHVAGQGPARLVDRHFVTSDGVRLHYVEAGQGRTLVFVPGWRMPASIWERQLAFFKDSYRVLALDPRGQGESEPTADGFYRERRARDIAEFLETASVDSAVLVGWSMAIPESLTYIEEHGTDRLDALVLVDWPYRIPDALRARGGQVALQYLRDPETVARTLLASFVATPQDDAWMAEMTRLSLAMPTSAAVAVLMDYIVAGGDWSSTLRNLNRPVLYAVSPAWAEDAAQLKAMVPDATIRIFDGSAHGFFIDQYLRFNQVLAEFLTSLE